MAQPTKFEIELIQRITRATEKLKTAMRPHTNGCSLEDPESLAPCSCGASKTNDPIEAALKELKLD